MRLTGEWRDLMKHEEHPRRAVAVACLVRTGRASRADVQAVATMAVSSEIDDSWTAGLGLNRLDQPDDAAWAFVDRALALDDNDFDAKSYSIDRVLEDLPSQSVVAAVVAQYGEARGDTVRLRLGQMLATVGEPVRTEEVRALVARDPGAVVPAQQALEDASKHRSMSNFSFAAKLRSKADEYWRRFEERVAEEEHRPAGGGRRRGQSGHDETGAGPSTGRDHGRGDPRARRDERPPRPHPARRPDSGAPGGSCTVCIAGRRA